MKKIENIMLITISLLIITFITSFATWALMDEKTYVSGTIISKEVGGSKYGYVFYIAYNTNYGTLSHKVEFNVYASHKVGDTISFMERNENIGTESNVSCILGNVWKISFISIVAISLTLLVIFAINDAKGNKWNG